MATTSNKVFFYLAAFVTLLWTGWVILMALIPSIQSMTILRAMIRILVVLMPALYVVLKIERQSLMDYLQLNKNVLIGVVVGLLVAGIYLLGVVLLNGNVHFVMPSGVAIWLNYIIGSPLAEEICYRGVVYKGLKRNMPTWQAIGWSALAFAILHLPTWILLDHRPLLMLLSSFGEIFIYGVVFALLVTATRSLWSSTCAHWLNNFVLIAFGL